MPAASVLAVLAHPDDESLAVGGLLAARAEAGARTAVVTTTWAEGTTRARELADALAILGAGAPRLLSYADARVPDSAPGRPRLVDLEGDEVGEAVDRLVEHLRDVRPDVIVTHDAHGGLTGHPDHVRTHGLTVLAVQRSGIGRLALATHPHSSRARITRIAGTRRTVHTVPDDEVTSTLDVTPWLQQKVAAVLAHRSEVARGALAGVVAGLPAADRAALLGTEWYAGHPVTL